MKNFIEMFEFLGNCDSKTMISQIDEYAKYLLKQCKNDSEIAFLTNIGKIKELNRLKEWYFTSRFPELLNGKKEEDEILTVEEAADYLKTTETTVYALLKKGKIRKREISTVDKPHARPIVRVRKSDIDRYLDGK